MVGLVVVIGLGALLLLWVTRTETVARPEPDEYAQFLRDHNRTVAVARGFLRRGAWCATFEHSDDPRCGYRVQDQMFSRLQPGFRLNCHDPDRLNADPCVEEGPCAAALSRYDLAWSRFSASWGGTVGLTPGVNDEDTARFLHLPRARQRFPSWEAAIIDVKGLCSTVR